MQASPVAAQPFAGVLGQVASRVRLSLPEQLPARTWQLRACRKPPAEIIAGGRGGWRVCGCEVSVDAG